tara:strand:+ start:214 stop:918 length:705 start_codon:yes stop_codon:yes gene_type:complete
LIAAPLAPPVVVIPQAVDRLVAGPVVVAQEWMAARQDPAGGMETTAGVIRPGVDPAMVSFEDADRPAMVHFAAVPETHQDLLAEAIVVKGSDALKTAVRVIAVMGTDALKTVVRMIGVSIQSALKTAAKVTGVSKDAALKSAGMVISALRGVVLMTGGSQTVVLELVASVMARPAAFAPAVASVEIVRLMISPVEKPLPMLLILWLMICSGAGMPLRLHWKPVVRSIASGAPVR